MYDAAFPWAVAFPAEHLFEKPFSLAVEHPEPELPSRAYTKSFGSCTRLQTR